MTDEPNADDLVEENADEALDAPADDNGGDAEDFAEEFGGGEIDAGALLAEAEEDQMRSRASWHLLHKEIFAFLFANCLFFVGALVAWTRAPSWLEHGGPGMASGLDSTRGAFIFALAIYGFWNFVFYLLGRQMKVWPYVLNALVALWVGIGGITSGIGSAKWKAAKDYLENTEGLEKTALDDAMVPMSTIGPGYWLLTVGGALVIILILKGLMSGHQQAKAAAAEQQGDGRRRRR